MSRTDNYVCKEERKKDTPEGEGKLAKPTDTQKREKDRRHHDAHLISVLSLLESRLVYFPMSFCNQLD